MLRKRVSLNEKVLINEKVTYFKMSHLVFM